MRDIKFKNINKVHFIGIGGIGVSAIARMMILEGKIVSGSDQGSTIVTEELAKLGATIYTSQKAEHISVDIDLVIYSIAVPPSNPEFAKAQEFHIPMLTYPEALGQISRDKYTIAVAGTHGKTTTTAMIAKVFLDGGLNPTVVVGSFLKDYKSNFIAGASQYFIAEACEYRRSFLNLHPKILVITNIEADHLDYYKDLADIQSAFRELAERVPIDGFIVCNPSDSHLVSVLAGVKAKIIDYTKINAEGLALKFPGAHMVADAKAALAVAEVIGLSPSTALRALNEFRGTWRRFDYKGQTDKGAEVYDDYAHHPQEIEATISGAQEKYPGRKIIVVFQPHLYSRTKEHLAEFGRALALADQVILVPIYAAREADDGTIRSEDVVAAITKNGGTAVVADNLATATAQAAAVGDSGSVILVMGAGDVTTVATALVEKPIINPKSEARNPKQKDSKAQIY